MAAPESELQKAIYDALKGSAAVMAQVSDVYDDTRLSDAQKAAGAPWGAEDGYISFGPESTVADDHDCIAIDEITVQLDVWSRRVGRLHCKQVCHAVRQALKDVTLTLPTHGHLTTDLVLQRILPDPDDAITHGVMQFTAHVEEVG
ncbi:MAG: DUF3168 domain-containing protein [Rhodobacteraceae bacterium]|nr:DUF3168 domain-containing protein [Paracoccaceae bacterium]